jgi:hypothetical protein
MGDDTTALTGTWTLESCVMEDVQTNERTLAWGEHPGGRLVLTPDGHWIVVQTAEGRKAPRSDAERADAFRSMLAYAGRYRTEGSTIVVTVDVAWDESWIGTEQVRNFRLDGDRLRIEAPPQAYANFGGRILRGLLVWKRAA